MDAELLKEQKKLNSERNLSKRVLESQKNKMKMDLLGSMGEDIDAVLSGKRVVENVCKVSFWDKIKNIFHHGS